MPRVHCMTNEAGTTDWPWVWLLALLNIIVISGYLKIFRFWRRAFLETEARDRNTKLMDLAWIFLWCAVCGYVASVVMFFWPAYRLVSFCLVPLAFFTWKFAGNLEPFRVSLSAKRLERELRESLERRNEELEALVAERTRDLEAALAVADENSEAKSRFLANMSHEIRTPMNAIVGFTDLLREDRDHAERHAEHVETIRRNTDHLLGLINDVLDLSRIEADRLVIEHRPVEIRVLLEDVKRLFAPRAAEHGIDLILDCHDSVPQVIRTDPTRIKQVVANLVSNAVKFTSRGHVRIEATHQHGRLQVSVIDTGPGIDAETCSQLFSAFVQADVSTTRHFGGSGLGLKISRDLARLMGGDIVVESEVGVGSDFTVTVDAPEMDPALAEQTTSEVDEETWEAKPLEGRRVLLVEDGEDNARLARFCLERAGADMVRAMHGREALDILESGEVFDVVLMDLQMPVMDGFETMEYLQSIGFATPIVTASASVMPEDRQRCEDMGCRAFLCKPYRRKAIIDVCLQVIEGERRAAA